MKKIVSLLLAALLLCTTAFTFVACGDADDATLDAAYNKYLSEYKFDSEGLEKLTVALSPDFAPMEFVDVAKSGDDQYVGFDVLLSYYIAKELNMDLEIKPMSFDACMAAVQSGNVDLAISGFSWTAERAENFLITDWYEAGDNETEQVLITTKENENKLTTTDAYTGMKIGAQGGSLQELLVKETFGEDSMVLFQNLNDAVEGLITGKIDALAVAIGNGEAFISANPDKIGFSGYQFEIEEKYKNNVILVNKNDNELCDKVNTALAKAKAAGLYDPWYEACQIYSQIKTIDELGYDDQGNKITE
ncbi:MAG: transporter substrate-binding domain-containing protein [Clostridia bacterium]|nr:transporter substrate-binding domain-containing protein [Clostridia bacterium]